METTYAFLELLGLGEDARERDIRSAYAWRLKRIDQARDPEAFQQLRSAYETALDWAAWKLNQEQSQDTQQEAESTDIPPAVGTDTSPSDAAAAPAAPDDPHALAQAVFARLSDDMEALSATPPDDDAPLWKDALRRRLDDAELFNIDARITFEAIVAAVLAHGWRPGHDSLFVAAQDVFEWGRDRRRLIPFGQSGAILDAAISEQHLIVALTPTEQQAIRRAAQALRDPDLPDTSELRARMRNIESMMARFPTLMRVTVSLDNVEQWRAAHLEMFGSTGTPFEINQDMLPPPPQPRQYRWLWPFGVMLAILLLRSCSSMVDSGRYSGQDILQHLQVLEQEIAKDKLVREHTGPIHFIPSLQAKAGPLATRVRVFLDSDGKVERTLNVQTSGEPAFDDAVRRALAEARPFPPEMPREFETHFSTTIDDTDLERARQSQAGVLDRRT